MKTKLKPISIVVREKKDRKEIQKHLKELAERTDIRGFAIVCCRDDGCYEVMRAGIHSSLEFLGTLSELTLSFAFEIIERHRNPIALSMKNRLEEMVREFVYEVSRNVLKK